MIRTMEKCPDCDEETEHEASIEVRQERDSYHSREPYRITTCQDCGHEDVQRLNS